MSRRRLLLPGAASLLALSMLSACAAPADSAPSDTVREWTFGSLEDGAAGLTLAERELDALLAHELGIDEAWGLSPEDAAALLPRLDAGAPAPAAADDPDDGDTGSADAAFITTTPGRASASAAAAAFASTAFVASTGPASIAPAEYPLPQPDAETVGAAANSLSLLHEVLRDALGEASLNSSDHSASSAPAAGQNPAITWSVAQGVASGSFTSSISDTNEAGDSVTVALEGQFEMNVCPDPDGTAEGGFFTTAAVTFTPSGGAPRRTAIDIDMETALHVTDQAYAAELWAKVESAVRTGAPGDDSPTRVPEPDSFRQDDNAYAFEFGDPGVQDRGELTADQQLDGAFSAQVDDLAEQIALLVARASEDYWRDGNCVDVLIEGEDVNPQPGDKQQLWVDAVSAVDGAPITRGTVEVTAVQGDSSVNPEGPQPIDEADYQFIAGQQTGPADPDFEVVSRRGIGRGGTGITVGGEAWTIDQWFAGAHYTGRSCNGIHGPWWIDVSIPAPISETWGTEFVFDENLRSHYTVPPTNGGEWVHPAEQYWLEPSGDAYILHNDAGGDANLLATRADASVCAE